MDTLRAALDLLRRHRDLRFLMGAQFLAQAGDGIVQVAIAKLIVFGGQRGFDLEDARDPDELLRIVLYIFVPYTVLSPFLGVVMDRWSRRRLLVVANGLRALVIGLVAIAGTSEVGDVPLYAALVLTLASTRVVLATKSAALPVALGIEAGGGSSARLVEANGLSQLGGAMFQLGGAGTALIAASSIDADPITLFGAVVYALGAVSAANVVRTGAIRERESLRRAAALTLGRIWAGLVEVSRTPQAAASITTYLWLRLLWSFSLAAIAFEARDLIGDSDLQNVILTGGAGALGAILGYGMADRLLERARRTGVLVMASAAVAGVATTVLGPLEMKASLAGLTFFLGLGFFLGKISLDTMVQEALGDDFRGRAFSLYDIAYNLAWVLAAAALKVGYTSESRGLLIASGGVVFLAGLGAIGAWYRSAGLLEPIGPATPEMVDA